MKSEEIKKCKKGYQKRGDYCKECTIYENCLFEWDFNFKTEKKDDQYITTYRLPMRKQKLKKLQIRKSFNFKKTN